MYIYDHLKSLTIITLSSKTMLKPETFEEEQNSKLESQPLMHACIVSISLTITYVLPKLEGSDKTTLFVFVKFLGE